MSFIKKDKVQEKDIVLGCANCSTAGQVLDLKRILSVGFGDVSVTRDGYCIYSEQECDIYPIAQFYEDEAAKHSSLDWRIHFFGPMHEEVYQRQGSGYWVMIKSGPGFA